MYSLRRIYYAGSHPTGRVNPYALKMIETARLSTTGLRSKPWEGIRKAGRARTAFRLYRL